MYFNGEIDISVAASVSIVVSLCVIIVMILRRK
jgi:hypothetical protein